MKTIIGYGRKTNQVMEGAIEKINQLNLFFNRFNTST